MDLVKNETQCGKGLQRFVMFLSWALKFEIPVIFCGDFFYVNKLYMYFVYALKSIEKNYIYVGLTNNVERRFGEHQHLKNKTTKPYAPFLLFHTESFKTRIEARNREIYLKSGVGKEHLKQLLFK